MQHIAVQRLCTALVVSAVKDAKGGNVERADVAREWLQGQVSPVALEMCLHYLDIPIEGIVERLGSL
mgnify:FL=1